MQLLVQVAEKQQKGGCGKERISLSEERVI
jgi:hypothetical protein